MLLDQYGNPFVFQSREDSWQNGLTGIGTVADKTAHGRFFPTFRIQDRELVDLFNGSSIAAKAVYKRPQEMFRRGYTLESPKRAKAGTAASTDEIQALTDYGRDVLDLDANVLEAFIWGRLFGGCLLVLGANDGGMPWEPLDESRIRSFDFLNLVDRRYAYVQSTYARRGHPKYGRAQIYLLSNAVAYTGWDDYDTQVKKQTPEQLRGIGANIALIHESRVIRFEGAVTDVVSRQQLAGWTYSVLQRVYGAFRSFEHAFDSANYLLSDVAQGIIKLKGLIKAITSGQQAALSARLAAMEQTRSVMRAVALDADSGESFERTTTPMSGVPDTLDRMMLRLCAEMDVPANELFGQGGGGLNAAGEAEAATRKWYDGIGTDQTTYLAPVLRRIYRLIGLAKRGPVGGKDLRLEPKFAPLWSPTDKEAAATRLTDAQRRTADIQSGVVTPEEVAPTVVDLYPDIDLEARKAARGGAKSFDPYENDPEPEPNEPPPDEGEPDSPASPNTSIEAPPRGAPGDPGDEEGREKRGDADAEANRRARDLEAHAHQLAANLGGTQGDHVARALAPGRAFTDAANAHAVAGHTARAIALHERAAEHFNSLPSYAGSKDERAEVKSNLTAARNAAKSLSKGVARDDLARARAGVQALGGRTFATDPTAAGWHARERSIAAGHIEKSAGTGLRTAGEAQDAHRLAGEFHLAAARVSSGGQREGHLAAAAEHAKAAGGGWDDDAHPRDEQGRFTSA